MLEQMASDYAAPCISCMGLVGASRHVQPHVGLLRSETDRSGAHICLKCGVLWELGALGWARVVQINGGTRETSVR
jgi:hypothetical protein